LLPFHANIRGRGHPYKSTPQPAVGEEENPPLDPLPDQRTWPLPRKKCQGVRAFLVSVDLQSDSRRLTSPSAQRINRPETRAEGVQNWRLCRRIHLAQVEFVFSDSEGSCPPELKGRAPGGYEL